MVKRLCVVVLILFAQFANAQYIIPAVLKDNFSRDILAILNDVPKNFESIKGKQVKADQGSATAYRCKVRIKGWHEGYILEGTDKKRTVHFPLNTFETIDEASAYVDEIMDKISLAMSRRVMLNKSDTVEDNKENVVLQSRIGYMNHSGFYQYNIYVEAVRSEGAKYQVQLRIKGGTPRFYYWVPKNEPVSSPLFIVGFRRNLAEFEYYSLYDCLGQLPGFRCRKEADSTGAVVITYTKNLYEMPNALFEYKVAVGNIKAAMGEE